MCASGFAVVSDVASPERSGTGVASTSYRYYKFDIIPGHPEERLIASEVSIMRTPYLNTNKVLLAFALFSLVALRASAQATYSQPRITAAVDDTKLTVLHGNTHPLAQPQFDRGPAPASLPMEHMLLVLQRSPAQEAALESFMAEQLDRSSPNYHHWLTPVQFGQMYGPAQQDIDVVTKWLGMHGFQVNNVANSRTTIDFSGNAAQVQAAFHTAIHQYVVKGEQHWANSSDPAIPTALTPVVAGIRSLHNFTPKGQNRLRQASSLRPSFTFSSGTAGCDVAGSSPLCFTVGPNDFATIYNVQQLWNNGIDGTGVTIGIVSDSNINPEDVAQFRALFGLPANVPNIIQPDGNVAVNANNDEIEAALDTEWAGAVAKGATIDLVVSPTTNSTFGGDTSAVYIIENNLASILSESYGACEYAMGTTGNTFYNTEWQLAQAEGITVVVASGDDGAAACDVPAPGNPPGCGFSASATLQPAQCGFAVNGVASTPYNVAVGGTDFNDLGTQSLYWNTTPGAQPSALKYVPEDVWNDTCTNALLFNLVSVTPAITSAAQSCSDTFIQADGLVDVAGSTGGESNCITSNGTSISSCSGGNARPAWQATAGTPGTTRDVPDVSLFAGDGFSGHFYVMCEMDTTFPNGGIPGDGQGNNPCTLGADPVFTGVGGTSVSAQAFAGIMALVDQKANARQGNASSVLYALAATQSNANCNASTPAANCFFNDVTVGTNSVPCTPGSIDCSTTASIPNIPSSPNPRINVRVVRIACAFCIGLLLLLGLRRKQQRWSSAAAMLALVLLVVNAGCGGGSSSTSTTTPVTGQGTPEGALTGYSAGLGYDLATGLGSVNALNIVDSTMWAAAPPSEPPATINRPTLTVPVATLAIAFALCLGLVFIGLRRGQIRWTTAVLLLAFALSILNAARSSASTRPDHSTPQRPAAARLVSLTGR